ncbi:hypothetical protein SAMN05892877_10675 [Rhizobium subbaraonis]|uniref:Uncharacterized protein n=1 Tax=Rhizobium subbaraonis TaxID=908946 RepID=A0A285UDT2_9HYPH|nr:hypothetical protein SAMN05892877_10675 [Rhizobium subbaraonis]
MSGVRLEPVPGWRGDVPPAVLATRQLSGICPASATIMKPSRTPI